MTYTQLLVLVGDTGAVVDEVHVVGDDGVTAVLGDQTDGHDDGKPPPVALGLHEVEVAGVVAGVPLELQGLADLAVFKLHGRVLVVSVGVVLGQDCQRLLVAVLGNEPSGRLGNPCVFVLDGQVRDWNSCRRLTPDEGKLAHRRRNLDEGDGPPRPVADDVRGAPTNEGADCWAEKEAGQYCSKSKVRN